MANIEHKGCIHNVILPDELAKPEEKGVIMCALLRQMAGWNRRGCVALGENEKTCPVPELHKTPDDQMVRVAVTERIFPK